MEICAPDHDHLATESEKERRVRVLIKYEMWSNGLPIVALSPEDAASFPLHSVVVFYGCARRVEEITEADQLIQGWGRIMLLSLGPSMGDISEPTTIELLDDDDPRIKNRWTNPEEESIHQRRIDGNQNN